MSATEFQKELHRYCTTINVCDHKKDYAVLYDDVGMSYLLCHACWNKEKLVRIDTNIVKIYRPNQLRSVHLQCLHCDIDITVQKKCVKCFPT